jgi:hypothetical protein
MTKHPKAPATSLGLQATNTSDRSWTRATTKNRVAKSSTSVLCS